MSTESAPVVLKLSESVKGRAARVAHGQKTLSAGMSKPGVSERSQIDSFIVMDLMRDAAAKQRELEAAGRFMSNASTSPRLGSRDQSTAVSRLHTAGAPS